MDEHGGGISTLSYRATGSVTLNGYSSGSTSSGDSATALPTHSDVVCLEERVAEGQQIFDRKGHAEHWKPSLEIFCTSKRGKQKEDKKLPKNVRRFYKAQDELIGIYEEAERDNEADHDQKKKDILKTARHANHLAKATFFINLVLFAGKIVATVLSGSLSILSSVIDSAVDLAAGVLLWWATRAVRKRNPYIYPQGRTKLEPIAIVILSVIMTLASVMVIVESAEKIIELAREGGDGPEVKLPTIIIIASTIVIKLVMFLICRRYDNHTVQALAQDHRNDVMSNAVALVFGFVGYHWWPLADPIGALLICIYIIFSWCKTGIEQIRMLTGHTADPEFLKRLTWIAMNHHREVKMIDTVRAFHFGCNYLVEIDIVLEATMELRTAHDIGEALQHKLERLPEVERAFVHLDYEIGHNPTKEHKTV